MTRRPPKVSAVPGTSAASDHACFASMCWSRSSRERNCPSEMGDRRVGTCLPCEDRPVRTKTTAHQGPDAHSQSTTRTFPALICTPLGPTWKDLGSLNFVVARSCPQASPAPGGLSTDFAEAGTAGDRVRKLPDMDPRTRSDPTIVVSTADPDLLDHALSVVAAAGLEAEVTSDPGSLRSRWSGASMLLIGVDQAAGVADLKLGRRAEVYCLPRPERRRGVPVVTAAWRRRRRGAGQRALAVRGDR